MTDKTAHVQNPGQLGFAFFHASNKDGSLRQESGSGAQASLTALLPHVQALCLEAPLDEVDQELLPLLELCESVLTRVLDVARKRGGQGWSEAEFLFYDPFYC